MTTLPTLTRRDTFLFAAGAAATAASAPPMPAQAAAIPKELNWDDPAERARIKAAMKGSTAEETIYSFFRLHLYAYANSGNLVPMSTMSNLNVAKWRPLPNGNYGATIYESGAYTKFDSDELLEEFINPITGEKREPWRFLGGPLTVEIGPDGVVTGEGATLKPVPMQIQVFGDTVMVPTASAFSFPNPLQPDQYPKESSGEMYYWDSHYVFFASLKDVLNKNLTSIPAHIQFNNLVSFHPWLGMGGVEGRSWGRAYGSKINSIDDIPPAYRKGLEKQTPEIFDLDNWTEPREDFKEFMEQRLS